MLELSNSELNDEAGGFWGGGYLGYRLALQPE